MSRKPKATFATVPKLAVKNNVLVLPRTEKGKENLVQCVRDAGGWDFPDGSNAADYDWDKAVAKAERDAEECLRWCERNQK